MRGALVLVVASCMAGVPGPEPAGPSTKPRAANAEQRTLARDIYAELIAIDTTPSGSTAAAAHAMAKRLRDAGYEAADVRVFEPKPGRGNLVARLRGTGKKKPVLLLAHLDVVAAKREDWQSNPFELVERDGFFYGRGTIDDKFQATAWVAALIRYKREGYRPDRDVILVLETDEEVGDFNLVGLRWLLQNHRDLIDAEFAINEGAALSSRGGKPLYNGIQVAEKGIETYTLEIRNTGGHASRPRKDNAIYELAAALMRLRDHTFPIELSDSMRRFFELAVTFEPPTTAAALRAVLANPRDANAAASLAEAPFYNAMARTTCVATRLDAGVSDGTLPPHARATVSCYFVPPQRAADVQRVLQDVVGPAVTISPTYNDPPSVASPMNAEFLAAVKKLSSSYWPGVPVVETMSPGGSDSLFLRDAGIPGFGHTGLESDLDDFRMHGKDERVRISSFHTAHQYLYELVKLVAGGR